MSDDRDERELGFEEGWAEAEEVYRAGYAACFAGKQKDVCPYPDEGASSVVSSFRFQMWQTGYAAASAMQGREDASASLGEDAKPLELLTPAGAAVQEITRYLRDNGMNPVEYMHGILAAVAGSDKE